MRTAACLLLALAAARAARAEGPTPGWVKTEGDQAVDADLHGDYGRAFTLAKSGAAHGDFVAMWELGFLYSGAVCGVASGADAAHWYQAARTAAQEAGKSGDARAAFVLARLTPGAYPGIRSPGDLDGLKKAAAAGYAPAQDMLGMTLKYGWGGVTKDGQGGSKWLGEASRQGHARAQVEAAYDRARAGDLRAAFELHRRAAETGYHPAQAAVAWYYINYASKRDALKADKMQALSKRPPDCGELANVKPLNARPPDPAKITDGAAQCTAGIQFEKGGGVPQDARIALSLYVKSASQGSGCGEYHLARLYATGAVPGGKRREAVKLYRSARSHGFFEASADLAAIYGLIAAAGTAPLLLLWLALELSYAGFDDFAASFAAGVPRLIQSFYNPILFGSALCGVAACAIPIVVLIVSGPGDQDSGGLSWPFILSIGAPTAWFSIRQRSGDRAAPAARPPHHAAAAGAEEAAAMASEKLVGERYEMDHLIGEGGMGLVYAGRDLKLGRFVAIKKMRPDLKANRRDRERFLKEARVSASLHDECIVDIFDVVDQRNEVYLVFEYVDGQTLDRRLDSGAVPAEELVARLAFICRGLAFAHGKGVAHRDLKPSNIMFTRSGGAKVMDFGIAREMQETLSRLTNTDSSGTLAYMAPEQELGTSDRRSDIYSLGITLYQALTGKLPFPGPNFTLQKERMVFEPLSQSAPQAPRELREAIERCLRREPAERFQTIDELARAAGLS